MYTLFVVANLSSFANVIIITIRYNVIELIFKIITFLFHK